MMQVALLRAVNVGGRSSLKMSDLRAVAEGLGFTEVRTLLQSGNLVFEAEGKKAPALEGALKAALRKHHGIETDFLVRSAKELDAIIAANPFRDEAKAAPSRLLVMFLQDHVAATAVQALRDAFKGPEIIGHKGRELYIVYPDGIGRSKLTGSLIEKRLGTRGTGRNWNTVGNSRIWRARSSLSGKRTHAVLHLGRHAVVAHQLARVAQAERLALHHEQPERMAGLGDQRAARLARLGRRLARCASNVAQRRERRLQPAPEPAERGGLLLRDLVVERGGRIGGPDIRLCSGRGGRTVMAGYIIRIPAATCKITAPRAAPSRRARAGSHRRGSSRPRRISGSWRTAPCRC